MKTATIWTLAGSILLAQSPTKAEVSGAVALADAMSGTFATRAGSPGTAYRDFRAKIPPLGPGQWIYFQRNQGADMRVYRQRVLQLLDRPDGSVAQITYQLATPEAYATAPDTPESLAALTRTDLVTLLNEGCEQLWRHSDTSDGSDWTGRVDPARCTIFSERRQTHIRIGSQTRLDGDALYEAERGFDLDGNQLWGTPQGEFSVIYRQSDPAE